MPRLWSLNTTSCLKETGLLGEIADPRTGGETVQGEHGISCCIRSKEVTKGYWNLSTKLKSQVEEVPTGSPWGSVNINYDNNCHELKHMKYT